MKHNLSKSLLLTALLSILPFSALQAQNYDALVASAVNNSARLEASRERDVLRKPAEVIKFMGVQPGDTVLDLIAIGGYYTEILAGVVGENGRVIAQALAAQGMDPNYAFAAHIRNSPHLDNVVPIYAEMIDLDLEENSVDQIFLIQNFHDLYVLNIPNR